MIKKIMQFIIVIIFILVAGSIVIYTNQTKEEVKIEKEEKTNESIKQVYNKKYRTEFNLPVVVIDTNGQEIKRREDIDAYISIFGKDEDKNYIENTPSMVSKANINIRGNSTASYPKKQYGITLTKDNGKENSRKIMEMSKNSKWILNGPFADKSLIRNYLAFNVANGIMEYAPDVKFCEVFVLEDGSDEINEKHYKGVYIMLEKIERDEDRVDITKTINNLNETSFIIAKDREKEGDIRINPYGEVASIYSQGFNIVYPKSKLTPDKQKYIHDYISEFERILYSDKFNDPIDGYTKYIDVDSFVDYYIINEFFKNTDAGLYSTYLYKDYEEKMKAGPVWDFNRSIGNYSNDEENEYEYRGFFMQNRPWFDRLMEDKAFANKVIERYELLRNTYLSDEYLHKFIDKTVDYLGKAIDRNLSKWPIELSNQAEVLEDAGSEYGIYSSNDEMHKSYLDKNKHLLVDTEFKAKTYVEEIGNMKEFIAKRGKWIDDNIDSLTKWAK